MAVDIPLAAAPVIAAAAYATWRLVKFFQRTGPKFPGPKGYPLIGNLFDLPTEHEYITFTKWGREYGDITSVTVLGQPMLILNSPQAAVDMLDKKSSVYSDRPHLTMASDLVGWKNVLWLTPYGDRFKAYRRMMHRIIGTRAAMDQYNPIMEAETYKSLARLLTAPQDFRAHLRKGIGAIILMISHGYKVQGDDDEMVRIADSATDQLNEIVSPGRFLVDQLPLLRNVPEWVPGATFQKLAREWRTTLTELTERSYRFVQDQLAKGTAVPSFTSHFIDGKTLTPQDEANIKWTAASLYSGGADTPVSALSSFILALTMYPDALRKAQAEVDAVVGNDRIPGFEDKDNLPYINATIKELLRWCPVTPLGAPHRLTQDDVHNGCFVPKGTIVMANVWGYLHDPEVYPDPLVFSPDRFVAEGDRPLQRDPYEICFGYGRRTCQGAHLAESFMYIFIVNIVALFDIDKVVENGVVQEPKYEFTNGALCHPAPFKCSIKPRSARAAALLQAAAESR